MGVWKRPLCRIAAGFLLGILFGAYGGTWYLVTAAAVLLMGCTGYTFLGTKRWLYAAVVFLEITAAIFFGNLRYHAAETFRQTYLQEIPDGARVSVQGRLVSKEYKNYQYLYYLTSCYVQRQDEAGGSKGTASNKTVPCNQVIVCVGKDSYKLGKTLVLNGTAEYWKGASNEGNFDAKTYYWSRGIDFKIKDAQILSEHGEADAVLEWLFSLRSKIAEVYAEELEEGQAGVLTTMVLGDKSILEKEEKKLYQKTGISHILAISGLHISVIGMSLYQILRKLGAGYAVAGMGAGILMAGYGGMVGMGTSVNRALLMFFLMLLAGVFGRSYDSLSALSAAALALTWENPAILFYAGFLLSFAAVTGVVYLGGFLEKQKGGEKRVLKRIAGSFLDTLGVSAAIQLATIPLVAWYYYEQPTYGIFANLMVLPFMALLLYLGIVGGLLGLVLPELAKLPLFFCQVILNWYETVCKGVGSLPGAVYICGQPPVWKMAGYYLLLLFLASCLYRQKKVKDTGRTLNVRLFAGGAALLFCLLFHGNGGFELDVLDVGQGDGIFLQTENGITMFVDGGSSNVSKVGEYRILPFLKAKGIRQIDFWAVSHTDADHISGLMEILEEGYPVFNLLMAENIERDEAFENLCALAKKAGSNIVYGKAGDILHLGDARIELISPGAENTASDKNGNSLVFYYEENGFTGLFTGDVGEAQERRILSQKKLRQAEFYKVAHHGSGGSNSMEYLRAVAPEISVVSCAKENSYGHPAPKAVENMEDAGSTIFYTMESGRIRITREGEELVVEKYLQPLDVFRSSVVK